MKLFRKALNTQGFQVRDQWRSRLEVEGIREDDQASWAASPLTFLGRRKALMLGRTPPLAMVVLAINLLSSSSFLIASWMCLGTILVFLLSLAAFPASSRTSAARYSRTAARYTGAPAPTLSEYLPCLRNLAILPTGNWSPAFDDLETGLEPLDLPLPPFPFPAILMMLVWSFKLLISVANARPFILFLKS